MKTAFVPQRRILICVTVQVTVKAFLNPHIRLLQEMGFQVDVAAKSDGSASEIVADHIYDLPFQRTPWAKQNLVACRMLRELVECNHYCAIHFHTPVASAFGRWSIRYVRRYGVKIFYTAHGFHFFEGAPLKNWLIYYPIERFLARYTDCLITINSEDYSAAKYFYGTEVVYVPGVGVSAFPRQVRRRKKNIVCPLLLSIGELSTRKNHILALKALAALKMRQWTYWIAGSGDLENELKQQVQELGIADRVCFLGYRRDIGELCSKADVFLFPSLQEGLPVALMEAMAAGLPVVASDIRGNRDLIVHGKGGLLVEPHDVAGFTRAISELLNRDDCSMGEFNRTVLAAFELSEVLESMRRIYRKHLKSYV